MTKFTTSTVYEHVKEPGDWPSIEAFRDWFFAVGGLFAVPWDAETIVSDDATAIALYRQGRWQVELYLVHPNRMVPVHAHPGMENLIVQLGGGGDVRPSPPNKFEVGQAWGDCAERLEGMATHGGRGLGATNKGYAMLTFEKWPEGVPVTSAAIWWKGETAGPRQEALIRRHYPDAIVAPGFADVTAIKNADPD